jgi:ABC-type phosphate transport system substrate-binding protein
MGRVGRSLAGFVAALGLSPAMGAAADVAVIVHPSNPQADVSFADLVQILKMERQHWASGRRIYVVLQESGTPEKELVLRKLYRIKDSELKQYYLGKLYRGEIASFPRIAHSNAAARRLVSQAPNAISFVDAASVDTTVKVLRIDRKRPGEPGYVLGSRPSEAPEAVSQP